MKIEAEIELNAAKMRLEMFQASKGPTDAHESGSRRTVADQNG
jgi:hypothetical protein